MGSGLENSFDAVCDQGLFKNSWIPERTGKGLMGCGLVGLGLGFQYFGGSWISSVIKNLRVNLRRASWNGGKEGIDKFVYSGGKRIE